MSGWLELRPELSDASGFVRPRKRGDGVAAEGDVLIAEVVGDKVGILASELPRVNC